MTIFLKPIHGTSQPVSSMLVFLSKADQLKISLGITPEEMDVTAVVIKNIASAPGNYVLINGKAYALHYMKRGEYKLKKLKDVQ